MTEAVERLHALAEAFHKIATAATLDEQMRAISDESRALVGAHQSLAWTRENTDKGRASHRVSLSEKYARWSEYEPRVEDDPLCANVIGSGRALRLTHAELEAHDDWAVLQSRGDVRPPLRGCLVVPLTGRDGRSIGIIALSDRLDGEFSEDDELALVRLARYASPFVEAAHAQRERDLLLASERAARADAERAARVKDEFVATLSHELRSPLNAILGWTQILMKSTPDKDVLRGLEIIDRNARLQAQMVEDLLDMSRILSGKLVLDLQRVDPAVLIEATLASAQPLADSRDVRLTVVRGSVGVIQGDPVRLQQVIWNLLSNAIKFTSKGGRVQVTLRRTASSAEIVVSDTGVGIKPEFLPHVFDRFRQADNTITRQYRGLGLGLSIVKSLAELHGGTVEAASPGEGLGATFTVRLPLIAVQPRDEAVSLTPPDPNAGPELAGLHVLVVDDELDAREMVACVLRERGATVTLAGSATEGVRAFQESRPDVIVSDIGMPGQDGYDMIRQIRAISPGVAVPAAALTALARPEDRRRALLSGFQTHVAKPVDGLELVAVVAALAGRTGV